MQSTNVQSLFQNEKISVITFSTQDASFAIPLQQVLYIEKDVKRNIQLDELNSFNHDVITYQNATVELYDFNKLIGSEGHRTRMAALVGELDSFEQAYVEWLEQIESSIKNATPQQPVPAEAVKFAKWAEQFCNSDTDLEEVIRGLATQCKELHKDIDKVQQQAKSTDAARSLLKRVHETSFKAFKHQLQLAAERAEASVRPIILFVEHNGARVSALRLDNIKDIVTYDWNNFSVENSSDGLMKQKQDDYQIEGFLRNSDQAPLMLINCKAGPQTKPASGEESNTLNSEVA